MWLIPLLVIGAVVFAAASRSAREHEFIPPSRQLAQAASSGLPGPISVLGEFLRIGQTPPPPVILCAIAEAEAIGRGDLASDIVRVFVAPVVYQHELANARSAHAPYAYAPSGAHARGSCELPRSPRAVAPLEVRPVPAAVMPSQQARGQSFPASDEEIRAMLNTNPEGFIEMVKNARPAIVDVPVDTANAIRAAAIDEVARQTTQSTVQPPPIPQSMPPMDSQTQPTGLPPEVVAQMQEDVGLHEAADQTRALAPGSPIANVSDDAWRQFVMRLERETPSYQSARHVGQYRQRRERLAELGIDSSRILGSAQAQRAALDVDLVDAHRHAADGGLLGGHLGRRVAIPGHDESEMITLSGVLGVIQCAGLDGAAGWLESQRDRKKFPHTTRAFLRTNGVF